MIYKAFFPIVFVTFLSGTATGQAFIRTAELFRRNTDVGKLEIVQDPAVDTLISRYIMMSNRVLPENEGKYGMDGYRIQIYNSSNRNAKEESIKTMADFISKFPDLQPYRKYSEPGYFKVRVGDFRTRAEATRVFLSVSRVFRNAYIVPDIINFPELTKK